MRIDINSEKRSVRRAYRFSLLAIGAMITGLTLVMPEIGIIEWIGLVPAAIALIMICRDESVRRRGLYGYGFFFFMCFYLVNYHWFINLYPLDFIDGMTKSAALAVIAAGWIGLSALQSVVGGLVFVLFGELVRGKLAGRFEFLGALLFAALWAIFEWTQTLTWAGVPWARLSIGQTGWLIGAQSASLFGACFVTFLIVAVNFFIAYAIISPSKKKLLALVAAGIFVINTAVGALLYFGYSDGDDTVKMAAVQGNISSQEKWNIELRDKNFAVYEKYTKEAAAEGADIIVWPETAMPYDMRVVSRYASRLAKETGTTILVGAFTESKEGEDLNSMVAVLPDGSIHETVYSKRHLVPFGEYVPLRGVFEVLIPPLTEIAMLDSDIAEGEGAQIIELDAVKIGALICFDSIYDELTRESVLEGANVITLSSNDSWFLDSSALYMHNAQAQLRAIENRRYVVRAANTGVSSIISARGEILCSQGALTEGQISADIHLNESKTLFTYIGNSFVYLCIALVLVWLIYEKIINKFLDTAKKK